MKLMRFATYLTLFALLSTAFLTTTSARDPLFDDNDAEFFTIAPIRVCPAYNPSAFSNACIEITLVSKGIKHASVQPGPPFCVISYYCIPTYTTGTTTTYVPFIDADGYVELTDWCRRGIIDPCVRIEF